MVVNELDLPLRSKAVAEPHAVESAIAGLNIREALQDSKPAGLAWQDADSRTDRVGMPDPQVATVFRSADALTGAIIGASQVSADDTAGLEREVPAGFAGIRIVRFPGSTLAKAIE